MNFIKKAAEKVSGVIAKGKKKVAASAMAAVAMLSTAISAHADNADLTTATTALTDGVGDMKGSAMVLIPVIIGVIVVIFGIFWLIGIVRRGMNKA